MDFPQEANSKLTEEEMKNVNTAICDMSTENEVVFSYFTKPNEQEMKIEVAKLRKLLTDAFYPLPVGASAPILDIFQRSLKLKYGTIRTSLALLKYYICPTLHADMVSFFVK